MDIQLFLPVNPALSDADGRQFMVAGTMYACSLGPGLEDSLRLGPGALAAIPAAGTTIQHMACLLP